jgi:hypothetical protein
VEEQAAIVQREQNVERRDFYELLWLTGAAQSDGACLRAEDIHWSERAFCFMRMKLKGHAALSIKPTPGVSFRLNLSGEIPFKEYKPLGYQPAKPTPVFKSPFQGCHTGSGLAGGYIF